MKKHHTNKIDSYVGIPTKKTYIEKEEPMSVNEALKDLCGNLPRWAIVLRGLRQREGLTQSAMGDLLGIPQGNISQMEHGKRPIGKQIAKRLANLFKTDYHLFL
jgi:DNA-binding XRE family transcriptional regulator